MSAVFTLKTTSTQIQGPKFRINHPTVYFLQQAASLIALVFHFQVVFTFFHQLLGADHNRRLHSLPLENFCSVQGETLNKLTLSLVVTFLRSSSSVTLRFNEPSHSPFSSLFPHFLLSMSYPLCRSENFISISLNVVKFTRGKYFDA